MVKYIEWGEHLRLGNFMFVYAGLQSILKDSGNQLCLPDSYFLWKYLQGPPIQITSDTYDDIFHFRTHQYSTEEKQYLVDYFRDNRDRVVNVNLGSNLQSELWFQEHREYVKNKLRIKQEEIDRVREKYSHIINNGKKTIGIGVRRGDFVNHGVFYQIPIEWYLKALKDTFPTWQNYNILFFSDHIEECKKLFEGDNFYFAEPNGTHTHADNFKHYHKDPMEQFILGTLCDHFIGGNSTFSWWQMWYVKNYNNGTVVHCGKNLSEKGEKEFGVNKNYYPDNWTLYPL